MRNKHVKMLIVLIIIIQLAGCYGRKNISPKNDYTRLADALLINEGIVADGRDKFNKLTSSIFATAMEYDKSKDIGEGNHYSEENKAEWYYFLRDRLKINKEFILNEDRFIARFEHVYGSLPVLKKNK